MEGFTFAEDHRRDRIGLAVFERGGAAQVGEELVAVLDHPQGVGDAGGGERLLHQENRIGIVFDQEDDALIQHSRCGIVKEFDVI